MEYIYPKITSRHKLYPLARNHGLLQQYNNVYFYIYKDLRVPLFHHNKPVPSNYINNKYVTLCKIREEKREEKRVEKSDEKSESSKKVIRKPNNSFKKVLQKIRLNQLMK